MSSLVAQVCNLCEMNRLKTCSTKSGDAACGGGPLKETSMRKYICDVCGWIYDPAVGDPDGDVAAGTAFEDIPDDWVCPECGADKSQFSPQG